MFIFDVLFKEKVHQIVTTNLRNLGVKSRVKKSNKTEKLERNGNSLPKTFKAPLCYLPMEVVTLSSGAVVHVPIFLSKSTTFLLKDIGHEGLFRKAGSQVRQRELVSKLDAGGELGEKNHVIDVANCLKSFFRNLPEPLIPYAYHDLFVRCGMLKTCRSEALLLACLLLPISHLYTLAYFMEFLKLVSANEKQNKMNTDNLAKVIGPNIMPLQETTMIAMQSRLEAHLSIVKFLIENAEKIGVLPEHIADTISIELTLSIENELNSSDSLIAAKNKKKKHRSGSLTRMFSGLKKMVGKNSSPNDLEGHDHHHMVTPEHHMYTPLTKVGKKRKVADITTTTNLKKISPVTTRIQKGLPVNSEMKVEKLDKAKKIRLSLDRFVPRSKTGKHSDIEKIVENDNEGSPYIERRWSGDGRFLPTDSSDLAKRRRTRSVSSGFPPSPRRDLKPINFNFDKTFGGVLMEADINLSDDERTEVKTKRKHPDSLNETSEEYVKIPKSEYEDIKNRVFAMETRISKEFETITKNPTTPVTVSDVQTEYEKTLEEANIVSTASTDILAKRLSKELKIRRSAEHKVIRSPSARRIGSLRRRSQEKPKIQRRVSRNSSWHISDKPANSSQTPVNMDTKCNLKRGRPLVHRDGQKQMKTDSLCSDETNARLDYLQEQLNTLISQTAEHTKGCDNLFDDELFHPVEGKISMTIRRASSFHGSEYGDDAQYFNNKVRELKSSQSEVDAEKKTPDMRREKTVTWKDADVFFQMEAKMRTPLPQTGRASVAKLRAQNAGMVLAKAKLFDENKNGVMKINKTRNGKVEEEASVRKSSARRKICTTSPKNSPTPRSRTKNSQSPILKIDSTISPIQNKVEKVYQKENKSFNYSQNSAVIPETNLKSDDSLLKTPHIKKPLNVKTPKSAKNLVRRPPISARRTPLKATIPVTPKRQSPRNVTKPAQFNRSVTSTQRN